MVTNRITEGVGKKIVEALKQQSDVEIQNVVENPLPALDDDYSSEDYKYDNEDYEQVVVPETITLNSSLTDNTALEEFELPTNVAVLKQLITQLPAGVSRQTGAQIIKQTMEALGISMKNVLQEAQSVQDNWNNSAKECHISIAEYRKQIGLLERQAQKYQKQCSALNDIISLFVQTNL